MEGWEPGADPVRALEEGQWGLALTPDPDAEHEATGVDEAHILQNAPGGRHTRGDGTEPRNGGERFRHAAEAEGVGAPEERGRQGFYDAPHREAGEHRIVHDGQGSAIGDADELLGQGHGLGADQAVATPPVFDPREADPPHARKPSGPRVELPRHPLARPADTQGQIERGVRALRDDAIDLLCQGEHDHPVSVAPQQLEERPGEGSGG